MSINHKPVHEIHEGGFFLEGLSIWAYSQSGVGGSWEPRYGTFNRDSGDILTLKGGLSSISDLFDLETSSNDPSLGLQNIPTLHSAPLKRQIPRANSTWIDNLQP